MNYIGNITTEKPNKEQSKVLELSVPKPVACKVILFRVFTGGKSYAQGTSFTSAVNEMKLPPNLYRMEIINITLIKDNRLSPRQLVDWLLSSHVHIILSHVHQGLSGANELMLGWNMNELARELSRLKNHVGFPTGNQLDCPVFTQDKCKYLSAIPRFCNPTFRVELNCDDEFDYDTVELQR